MKEKFKINTLHCLTYDIQRNDGYYITICEKDRKYGIIDNFGEVFLPFEYDNISRIGLSFIQLVKDGSAGLVHLGESDGKFVINQIIPCEYDYIEIYQFQNVVLMHKNDTYEELKSVYFGSSEKLIHDVEFCSVLKTFTNLITLNKDGLSYLYDCGTGNLLYTTSMTCVDGYNTPENRIVQYIAEDGKCCMVVINDNGTKERVFDTNCIIAVDNVEVDDFPLTVGFLVENSNGYMLLDEECGILAYRINEVDVKSVIEFEKDGERRELEIDSKNFDKIR